MDSDGAPLGSDNPNSKTKLIDVQHIGVTAKLHPPLKKALPECSSGDTDEVFDLFKKPNKKQYNKLNTGEDSESTMATTSPPSRATSTTDTSKVLYEFHAEQEEQPCCSGAKPRNKSRMRNQHNFSRIEFQLYNKSSKRLKNCKCRRHVKFARKRLLSTTSDKPETKRPPLFTRLRTSLKEMCIARAPPLSQHYADISQHFSHPSPMPLPQNETQPPLQSQSKISPPPPPTQGYGVYAFDHGCADSFRVYDCPPQLLSNELAERATYFATRFWAEFFGGLHIGISFVVTFLLQSYRFLLYSLINTLLVGLLQMTSDYFLKPILTVAFNGFLQPPLIFLYNILSSFRDVLEPISDALNNFMKPVATVGRSFRLIQATYHKKKFIKDV